MSAAARLRLLQPSKISLLALVMKSNLLLSSFRKVSTIHQVSSEEGCLRGVMAKAMDCGIVVSEFVLQSRYYVHFRSLGKDMNPLIFLAMGEIVPLLFF